MSGMQGLLAELDDGLAGAARGGGGVARALERYAGAQDDWRRFALFCHERYARNLVRCSELYELLVLCWQPGQVSPIHNHQGQRCWMAVLEGDVRETQFALPDARGGALRALDTRVYAPRSVAYITDDIGLHEIGPAGEGRAITLHLYSRPIPRCEVYDRDSGRMTLRSLDYHSVDGDVRTTPAGLAAGRAPRG